MRTSFKLTAAASRPRPAGAPDAPLAGPCHHRRRVHRPRPTSPGTARLLRHLTVRLRAAPWTFRGPGRAPPAAAGALAALAGSAGLVARWRGHRDRWRWPLAERPGPAGRSPPRTRRGLVRRGGSSRSAASRPPCPRPPGLGRDRDGRAASTARASAAGSRGGTSTPVTPSSTTSGMPPTPVATTGTPAHWASTSADPSSS